MLHPQASTKSSTQSTPPVAPPVERLVPGEHHGPIIPHPPSYASTLVPPPVSEPITSFVPLATGTEETSAPPSPESLPNPPPTGDEHVAILVPEPQLAVLPAEPINVPSQMSTEPLTAPSLVDPSVEPLTPPPATTSEPVAIPPPTTDPLTEPVTSIESSVEPVNVSSEPTEPPSSHTLAAQPTSGESMDLPVKPEVSSSPISIPAHIQSVLEESAVSLYGSASSGVLPDEMPCKTQLGPISTGEPAVASVPLVEEPVAPSFIDQLEVFPPQTHVNKFIIWFISLTKVSLVSF